MPKTLNQAQQVIQLLESMLKEYRGDAAPTGREIIAEALNQGIEAARQDCITEWGIDPNDAGCNFLDPRFSPKKFLREAQKSLNITESVAYSTLASVARVGIYKAITTMYQRQDFNWAPLVTVIPSNSWSTFMTAMYDSDIPNRVGLTEEADESRLIGKNFEIVNHEYARILRIPKALINDDQTGQVMDKANRFGRGMALREYKEVIAMYLGKSAWTNSQSGDITGPNLKKAYNTLRKITDAIGEFMVVMPNMLICDTTRAFQADQILHSDYQSDQPDGVAGNPGYFMTKNVLKDKFTIHDTPFMTSTDLIYNGNANGADAASPRWYMSEAGVGAYFSDREPLQVSQEIPGAGKSWSTRSIAFQVSRRFGTLIVDDYAILAGNG